LICYLKLFFSNHSHETGNLALGKAKLKEQDM